MAWVTCSRCKGSGEVPATVRRIITAYVNPLKVVCGTNDATKKCPKCDGKGKVWK